MDLEFWEFCERYDGMNYHIGTILHHQLNSNNKMQEKIKKEGKKERKKEREKERKKER